MRDAKELELLKEFFASRIETLKLRIEELLNEKEDFSAMHQSDSAIKEYLTKRLSESEQLIVEKTTELLFIKKRAGELEDFQREFDSKLNAEVVAAKELKLKTDAEVDMYKKRNHKLSRENKVMRGALKEMTQFFDTVAKT